MLICSALDGHSCKKRCVASLELMLFYYNAMPLQVAIYKKRRLMVVFLYNQTLYQ